MHLPQNGSVSACGKMKTARNVLGNQCRLKGFQTAFLYRAV
ncbi:hypothetical protein M702_09665 [Neisseria gonorrhoeae SK28355]|nr:hypothetical protein M702_09665 [Neisseria gonorrhoeae SK28355]KLS00939.1 hypothetical protein M683_00570 [Neisseria gonorrhoeae SK14515]KLS03160.1 hypothetical protein M686_11480 [Neisseria gonorrhoeae SK16942]KLS08357.1 hypothetical protein M725_07780 [Neisseria gonorrhoeae ATL_2011_01_08]KLS15532.1 hypothetical protein M704_05305 [Neisseria gonorrhoeae SK29471]KLS16420.1 hypothetical protein M687_09515 [Neisseria gonorrhoeae SK17973]KLS31901.1 hypothetical protein M721_08915 [Neisseria 